MSPAAPRDEWEPWKTKDGLAIETRRVRWPGDAAAVGWIVGAAAAGSFEPLDLGSAVDHFQDDGHGRTKPEGRIALIGGEPVGLALYGHPRHGGTSENRWFILTAVVVPARLRRRGIGRTLVEACKRFSARCGLTLVAAVPEHDRETCQFLARCGLASRLDRGPLPGEVGDTIVFTYEYRRPGPAG